MFVNLTLIQKTSIITISVQDTLLGKGMHTLSIQSDYAHTEGQRIMELDRITQKFLRLPHGIIDTVNLLNHDLDTLNDLAVAESRKHDALTLLTLVKSLRPELLPQLTPLEGMPRYTVVVASDPRKARGLMPLFLEGSESRLKEVTNPDFLKSHKFGEKEDPRKVEEHYPNFRLTQGRLYPLPEWWESLPNIKASEVRPDLKYTDTHLNFLAVKHGYTFTKAKEMGMSEFRKLVRPEIGMARCDKLVAAKDYFGIKHRFRLYVGYFTEDHSLLRLSSILYYPDYDDYCCYATEDES
jgi:hypothetical protein